MKKTHHIKYFLFVILNMLFVLNSCKPAKKDNEQLKGFMLAGIYFIDGYGGYITTKSFLLEQGRSTDQEFIDGYRLLLEFPYEPQQKEENISYLKKFWEINDKIGLLNEIEALKQRGYNYKAWDYARAVNISCVGYSAGYLTKEEVLKILNEILPLVQSRYPNWKSYFTDYNSGLQDWDAQSAQAREFKRLTKQILKDKKSIYNLVLLAKENKDK
ncbi:MAG TPA: DUF1266 domain-containing protein [Flavobacteriia bacterium]|nr:DUF1266 domain-containing protein [Flavobacteriia bacterium]